MNNATDTTEPRGPRPGRFRGNGVAIALAALAVVIAGTGTAVAATSAFTIADGKVPTQLAAVDSTGKLRVGTPLGTLNSVQDLSIDTMGFMTSPTTATIAVSSLTLTNMAGNRTLANSDMRFYLYRVTVGANGSCSGAGTSTFYGSYDVVAGNSLDVTFPTPVTFLPGSGKKYCIGVFPVWAPPAGSGSSPAAGTFYSPRAQLNGYVVGGSYSGLGTSPAAVARLGR